MKKEVVTLQNEAIKNNPENAVAFYNKACFHALLGEASQAVSSLKRAIELREICRDYAKQDSDFDKIRSNSEFKKLIGSSHIFEFSSFNAMKADIFNFKSLGDSDLNFDFDLER